MATEQQQEELQKICIRLEDDITAKNQELANLNQEIKARTQAGEGDVRLATMTLKKEISDLEVKKSDLANVVTAALAEVTAEKIKVAQDVERVKGAQADAEAKLADVSRMLRDIESREAKLSSDVKDFEAAKMADVERVHRAQETINQATIISDEAGRKSDEAAGLLKDAEAKMESAKSAVADLTNQANAKLVEAQEIREQVEQDKIALAAQLKEALALKDEYQLKLAASEEWAMKNSEVSGKLSAWEAALRWTEQRLQDDQAKLAIAERAFAEKNKTEEI